VTIVGILLQTIGAVILGALTLQPNAVLSTISGVVLGAIGGCGVEKFICGAAVRAVGGQGIKVSPPCRKIKLGNVGWEGGGGKWERSWRSCVRNLACWCGG
jgi:hypothetical protein